jgi:hypothetical protein
MNRSMPDWLQVDELPDWVHWIAQDADGQWWGYEVEPLEYHAGWYENELGKRIQLVKAKPNSQWQKSLYQIQR